MLLGPIELSFSQQGDKEIQGLAPSQNQGAFVFMMSCLIRFGLVIAGEDWQTAAHTICGFEDVKSQVAVTLTAQALIFGLKIARAIIGPPQASVLADGICDF